MMNKSISSLPSIFIRHRWPAIATFVSVMCGSLAYLAITPRMYEANVRLIIDSGQLTVSDYGREITQPNSTQYSNPIATQVEVAKSQRVLEQALVQVSLQGINDLPQMGTLNKDLKVVIVPATSILDLRYRSPNPLLTSALLNAIADVMVKENTKGFRDRARSLREFLETEVPKSRAQLAQAAVDESNYKKSSGAVSLGAQTQSLVQSLASLEAQDSALSAQLQEAKGRESALERTTDRDTLKNTYAAVRSGQDPELNSLRAKLADLESQVSVSRTRLTDNNPTLLKLIEQRNSIRALYTQKLSRLLPNNAQTNRPSNVASDQVSQDLATRLVLSEIERSGLEGKLGAVRREEAKLQARLAQLPNKEEELAVLTSQREQAASSVQLLQRKLDEARIAEAELGSNLSIIQRAVPPKLPNWPKKSVVLVIANAAGIILAIGVVLLLEVLDGTLRNATEAEKLVNLPVLGVLPILRTTSLSPDDSGLFLKNPVLVQSYRMLLNTMQFRSVERAVRVVVVSSTLSGEGKSVVVSHLAAVSAMSSRRTLIVDTDFCHPTQHKLFNLAAQPGLTDVIEGRVAFAEAVQQTSINHLWVVCCGESHPSDSHLLESVRMRTFLEEAAAHYDLVIVDTPPVTSSFDATHLSRNSDGLLLVARPHFTKTDILQRAVSQLTSNQVSILGVAVNGISNLTEMYYQYPNKSYQPPVNR